MNAGERQPALRYEVEDSKQIKLVIGRMRGVRSLQNMELFLMLFRFKK